ncbi:unannotated protein [freshwater metagenome]|uniref:Unannotated protein n=1 Tax=freshwater metagenome TaxID=449393 RepID=A0A6J7D224_9ZZZZ
MSVSGMCEETSSATMFSATLSEAAAAASSATSIAFLVALTNTHLYKIPSMNAATVSAPTEIIRTTVDITA